VSLSKSPGAETDLQDVTHDGEDLPDAAAKPTGDASCPIIS
jgi:hypothetical protein